MTKATWMIASLCFAALACDPGSEEDLADPAGLGDGKFDEIDASDEPTDDPEPEVLLEEVAMISMISANVGCSSGYSSWRQTCNPWTSCSHPITSGDTRYGSTDLTIECSLREHVDGERSLSCDVRSTYCRFERGGSGFRLVDLVLEGPVDADGRFALTNRGQTGSDPNRTSWRHQLRGSVSAGESSSLTMDHFAYVQSVETEGTNGSTEFRSSYSSTVTAWVPVTAALEPANGL